MIRYSYYSLSLSRWWFQSCFIFIPIWGNDPIWLIFFRWVETTQILFMISLIDSMDYSLLPLIFVWTSRMPTCPRIGVRQSYLFNIQGCMGGCYIFLPDTHNLIGNMYSVYVDINIYISIFSGFGDASHISWMISWYQSKISWCTLFFKLAHFPRNMFQWWDIGGRYLQNQICLELGDIWKLMLFHLCFPDPNAEKTLGIFQILYGIGLMNFQPPFFDSNPQLSLSFCWYMWLLWLSKVIF